MEKDFCPAPILTTHTFRSPICKLILTKINCHMRISVWKTILECYLKDWLSTPREYRWQRKFNLVWLVNQLGAYKVWLKSIFKCSYQLHWPAPFPGWSIGLSKIKWTLFIQLLLCYIYSVGCLSMYMNILD